MQLLLKSGLNLTRAYDWVNNAYTHPNVTLTNYMFVLMTSPPRHMVLPLTPVLIFVAAEYASLFSEYS